LTQSFAADRGQYIKCLILIVAIKGPFRNLSCRKTISLKIHYNCPKPFARDGPRQACSLAAARARCRATPTRLIEQDVGERTSETTTYTLAVIP
jgi:hypothetical protein